MKEKGKQILKVEDSSTRPKTLIEELPTWKPIRIHTP
jgi:hypothetical protein